ncbi:MAG: hypothetical protein V4481_01215 [Patescibacteria group bacterium]
MNANITLYGCLEHFFKEAPSVREASLKNIQQVFTRALVLTSQMPTAITFAEPTINLEKIPMSRVYLADVELSAGDRKQSYKRETLLLIAKCLGEGWTEFVRTFIDSGALIAIRISDSETQVRWSPHGTEEMKPTLDAAA